MNQLITLLKREYWEHRAVFLYVPAVITGLFLCLLLVGVATMNGDNVSVDLDLNIETPDEHQTIIMEDATPLDLFSQQLGKLASQPVEVQEQTLDQLLVATSTIWFFALWIIMLFYFLGCLYQDRKDRTFLFWSSMPVPDWMTVVSKLAAGLGLMPIIYFAFVMFAHLALISTATLVALSYEGDAWQVLWTSSNMIERWFKFFGYFLFAVAWCWPFFTWLLLVSSRAKSMPLFWAAVVPLAIVAAERLLTSSELVSDFIGRHMFGFQFWQMGNFEMDGSRVAELMIALILGTVFMVFAIRERTQVHEIY